MPGRARAPLGAVLMANQQAQFGFKHIGYLSGGAPDYQLQTRSIQTSNATKIGFGDPVSKTAGTNYIVQASGTAAGTPVVGIFYGCQFIPSTGGPPTWSPFWPGASAVDATAYILNAPNALFLVASLQTAIVTANIGANVGFTTGAPVTTGGGFSIATVDQSTLTTNANYPFQVVSMMQGVGNGSDPTTNYNWVVVSFQNQMFRNTTGEN